MARSICAGTTVVSMLAALFSLAGSDVADVMVAVLMNSVPSGVPGGTCPTSVKVPAGPGGKVGMVQVTAPPAPTAGVVQDQPAGAVRLTNVMVAGSGSESDTVLAASGPTLFTGIE